MKLDNPKEYLEKMKVFDPDFYNILKIFIGHERLNPEDNIGEFSDFVCDSPNCENK